MVANSRQSGVFSISKVAYDQNPDLIAAIIKSCDMFFQVSWDHFTQSWKYAATNSLFEEVQGEFMPYYELNIEQFTMKRSITTPQEAPLKLKATIYCIIEPASGKPEPLDEYVFQRVSFVKQGPAIGMH